MHTSQTIEPATAKPAGQRHRRSVDPWDRWSVKSRFVEVNLTAAGNHVYDCVDRICMGNRNRWVTVDEVRENDPINLKNVKRIYKGAHDNEDHGFMQIRRTSASSTAAFRMRVTFNSGRGTANGGDPRYDQLGPVAPGVQFYDPLKAPAAKKRSRNKPEKVVDADGREVIVHEHRPRCLAPTKEGSQCPGHAKAGSDLCGRHDQLHRQKVTTPPDVLSGGTPLSPISELPTPPPDVLVAAIRTICPHIPAIPSDDLSGGGLFTRDGREGRTGSSDRKACGLSTATASQYGYGDGTGTGESESETLLPVGDGQVVSVVTESERERVSTDELSSGTAEPCGESESLVPEGVARVADRGAGELLENEGVINLHEAEISEMTHETGVTAPADERLAAVGRKCDLDVAGKLIVLHSPYNKELAKDCRDIAGRAWDAARKVNTFPVESVMEVLDLADKWDIHPPSVIEDLVARHLADLSALADPADRAA